jgi:hypothetical protein
VARGAFVDFFENPHSARRIPSIHFDVMNQIPLVVAWSKNGLTALGAVLIAITLNLVVFVSMKDHDHL